MKKKGRVIVISAPSGAGKTTVINHFLAKNPNMIHSVSCTTRPIRDGEKEGVDYHYIDEKTFRKMIAENKFAEWAEVHDHIYGTPKGPLDKWLSEDKDVLLDLDVVGGTKLTNMYRERAISIFLLPPSLDELKTRLFGRATDTKSAVALRLKNAMTELTYKDKYDYQVVNDDLERTCKEIEEILRKNVVDRLKAED